MSNQCGNRECPKCGGWTIDGSCARCFAESVKDTRIATLERELAAVTAERDALLAGTRAGPWEHDPERPWGTATCETWNRSGPFSASVTVVRRPDPVEPMSVWGMAPGLSRAFASVDEAKAACDAALLAAGWYLAPTPPTGTPGDGTR